MNNYNNEYKNEENIMNSIENENKGWTEIVPNESINYTLSIIFDALCYLFEFKVENHKIYYREMQ